jgi:hypothetical protein
MIFAFLGNIKVGDAVWTGPNAASEKLSATLVEHKVARGKPPIQDMGDELATKQLEFFFDETFCHPTTELRRLSSAFAARQPMTWVAGDGAFNGIRWIVENLDVETLRTSPRGRPTRLRVKLQMKEVPGLSPLTFFAAAARAGALAIGAALVGGRR